MMGRGGWGTFKIGTTKLRATVSGVSEERPGALGASGPSGQILESRGVGQVWGVPFGVMTSVNVQSCPWAVQPCSPQPSSCPA